MSRTALAHWSSLWRALDCRGDATIWYRQLHSAYNDGHRAYHNIEHIGECLEELDACRDLAEEPRALEMALWFHDAVYDPQSNTNERDSAELAAQCLSEGALPSTQVDEVRRLILCTQLHGSDSLADKALIVDIDLSILGRPSKRYWQYERGIAAEYAWVQPTIYAEKRSGILASFLARPTIYLTPRFQERYELAARNNLRAAIQRLKAD
jgi:predicted metal-dependent HD superfamily phosphohydrolase